MTTSQQALQRLKDGNARYIAGESSTDSVRNVTQKPELVVKQQPFAIILGCSDSRVPAELVFDQGLGDLFVIRVAGNIVATSQVGSIEYCVEQFDTQLVVVMGHSNCGAIHATINSIQSSTTGGSKNIQAIVNRIRPSVEPLCKQEMPPDNLMQEAVRANVRAGVRQLPSDSPILKRRVSNSQLNIVGAEYNLSTGRVDFFDA